MLRKSCVRCCGVLLAMMVCVTNQAADRPNIVFIMADDLGVGDLGCYGQQLIATPRVDALAASGVRFTACYAGAPVCAPSRCVLMTGLHTGHSQIRDNSGRVGGVRDELVPNSGQRRIPLRADDVTLAEVLQGAGYATAIAGKWGLGEAETDGVPTRQGFDEWLGFLNQNHAEFYYTEHLWRNERKYAVPGNQNGQRQTYVHDLFTQFALDFIREHRAEPFFLYLPYTIPHLLLETPSQGIYADRDWPDRSKIFAAMITHMDRDVGMIVDLLDELQLAKNTLVFFTSDNGSPMAGGDIFRSNGSLKGGKATLHEGGLRVPMIIRWPGNVPEGQVNETPWYFADVLPTLAALTGAPPPAALDGISVLPTWRGEPQDLSQRFLYWERPKATLEQAVRFGNWKGVRLAPDKPVHLFKLSSDPGEERDVAASHPDVVAQIESYLRQAHIESPHWPTIEQR